MKTIFLLAKYRSEKIYGMDSTETFEDLGSRLPPNVEVEWCLLVD